MNIDYKFLFRDNGRMDRIGVLCKQMFPQNGKKMAEKIVDYFRTAKRDKYTYICINLASNAPRQTMIVANDLIRDKEHAKYGLPKKPVRLFTYHD